MILTLPVPSEDVKTQNCCIFSQPTDRYVEWSCDDYDPKTTLGMYKCGFASLCLLCVAAFIATVTPYHYMDDSGERDKRWCIIVLTIMILIMSSIFSQVFYFSYTQVNGSDCINPARDPKSILYRKHAALWVFAIINATYIYVITGIALACVLLYRTCLIIKYSCSCCYNMWCPSNGHQNEQLHIRQTEQSEQLPSYSSLVIKGIVIDGAESRSYEVTI